jgi:hypothetical protein
MDRPRPDPARAQRRVDRAPFVGWVELALDGSRRRARALDLSVLGIGVELGGPVPAVREPVVSEFALPGISLPLALEGVVAWTDPGRARLGVAFADVDPGLAELLASFVAGRL